MLHIHKLTLCCVVTIDLKAFLNWFFWLILWCLMPLLTIFQLYFGSQLYWWRKPEYLRKQPTYRKSLKIINHIILHQEHPIWAGFKLTMLVLIVTDCIGSCKSNNNTITTYDDPLSNYNIYRNHKIYICI